MAKDKGPEAPSPTGPQHDAQDTPPNVEVPPQNHTRDATNTSQTADIPVGVTASVASAHRIENLAPRAKDPSGLVAASIDTEDASDKQLSAFLKITGYKKSDVIGSSKERRTFVTSNGGKYELSPKGQKVRVLSGPIPPGPKEEEDDD